MNQDVTTIEDLEEPLTYRPEIYFSPEVARLEEARLWPKVWQHAGRLEEIPGSFSQPLELILVALHHHQRPREIGRIIGCQAELAARLQLRGKQVNWAVIHHPPLRMP